MSQPPTVPPQAHTSDNNPGYHVASGYPPAAPTWDESTPTYAPNYNQHPAYQQSQPQAQPPMDHNTEYSNGYGSKGGGYDGGGSCPGQVRCLPCLSMICGCLGATICCICGGGCC